MIGSCRTCKRAYWRYRRDWPPSGYCSLLCHDIRPAPSSADSSPQSIKFLIRVHRAFTHPGAAPGDWLDCVRCDELESQLAEALRLETCFTPESTNEETRESAA